MFVCLMLHSHLLTFVHLQGIPEAAEVVVPVAHPSAPAPGAAATTAPAPAMPAAPAPAAPGGPNAAPLDLFPQV